MTDLQRPSLSAAARRLSRQMNGMVRPDHDNARLVVTHHDVAPPTNFMGWPVVGFYPSRIGAAEGER